MENEQNKDNPLGKKDQARNLFFQTGLTQAQIAELVGVAQKTVSVWMNDGKWKILKDTAEHAPTVLIEQMTSELAELHTNIAARQPGQRYATLQEAEIRRKIMVSMSHIKEQQTNAAHIEVMMNFIHFVSRQNAPELQVITDLADRYLAGERSLYLNDPFKPYSLPGQFILPPPAGTAPAAGDNTPPPPATPGTLNEAA